MVQIIQRTLAKKNKEASESKRKTTSVLVICLQPPVCSAGQSAMCALRVRVAH